MGAAEDNRAIENASPALAAALSPLGRRVSFPPDIPFQAAEAKTADYNGTIGQITDGHGGAVPLSSMAAALAGLAPEDANRALLYSPVEGLPDLRQLWGARQCRGRSEATPSTLPVVTVGLTHGLSIAADLFAGEGSLVAVPAPFWGNYRQTFANRTGAEMREAPAYVDGRYNCEWPQQALAGRAAGERAMAIVNLPSNPGGYSVTAAETERLLASLERAAEAGPLVVLVDDAYAGLVYEEEAVSESLFWRLAGRHENLVPVKVDGATKEVSFFGGRVGFVTFAFESGSEVEKALVSKVKCLTRAAIGSPVASSQVLLLAALRDDRVEEEIAGVRRLLGARYRALKTALATVDPELLRPLPFNSGCFALAELGPGVAAKADEARRHLLAHQSTGVIAIGERYLRLAFCSVEEAAIPELVRRVEAGLRELGSTLK